MKKRIAWIAAPLGALALTELLIFSNPGLGFTLLFLSLIPIYLLIFGVSSLKDRWTLGAMIAIVLLSLPYVLYNNASLRTLNFLAIALIAGAMFLRAIYPFKRAWDRPLFIVESILGWPLRAISVLFMPWKSILARLSLGAKAGEDGGTLDEATSVTLAKRKRVISIALQVGVALVVAIPLCVILLALLFSADSVFAEIFSKVGDFFLGIRLDTLAQHIIVFFIALVATAGMVWSYCTKKLFLVSATQQPVSRNLRFPAVSALTVMALVDIIYAVYAVVQFVYLFGGAQGHLPANLTYAEYARSGFFELAALSAINFVLILLSVHYTRRDGAMGIAVRVFALLLIALSSVQLVSAFTRMDLYIQAYGLSMLRVFVTAFMVLLGALFIILVVREFAPKLPVFKAVAITVTVALIALNFVVPDRLIASYNISHYLSGDIKVKELDLDYLWHELSYDSDLVVLQNKEALSDKSTALAKKLDKFETDLAYGKDHPKIEDDAESGYADGVYGYLSYVYLVPDDKPMTDEEYKEINWEEYEFYTFPYWKMRSSWKNFNVNAWKLMGHLD